MVPPGTTHFYVWEKASGEPVRVDTEFKTQDLTAAAWSRGGMGVDAGGGGAAAAATLALGTSKGNLLLYNAAERRKTPYLGKHTKRITSAMWVGGDVLVMCGLDRIVTVTDAETGDTIKAFSVKGDPAELLTPVQKPGVGSGGGSSHLPTTCIVNAKSLVLGNVGEEKPKPSELNFLDVYGDLGRHVWIDDSHVALGFNGEWRGGRGGGTNE